MSVSESRPQSTCALGGKAETRGVGRAGWMGGTAGAGVTPVRVPTTGFEAGLAVASTRSTRDRGMVTLPPAISKTTWSPRYSQDSTVRLLPSLRCRISALAVPATRSATSEPRHRRPNMSAPLRGEGPLQTHHDRPSTLLEKKSRNRGLGRLRFIESRIGPPAKPVTGTTLQRERESEESIGAPGARGGLLE